MRLQDIYGAETLVSRKQQQRGSLVDYEHKISRMFALKVLRNEFKYWLCHDTWEKSNPR